MGMIKTIEGNLLAEGMKFALVVSRFNDIFSERLVGGAVDSLRRRGAREEDLTIYKVPGAFEIPLVAKRVAESKKFDAVICLGAVIRGSTPHFDYVAAEVSKGIASVSLRPVCRCSLASLPRTPWSRPSSGLAARPAIRGSPPPRRRWKWFTSCARSELKASCPDL